MDLLLTFAVVVAPLVLAWYLLGRRVDDQKEPKNRRWRR